MTSGGDQERTGTARPLEHPALPVEASPSSFPIQHLVSERDGATALYVGQQWLPPGGLVRPHTHPVEEALIFLAGTGAATLGGETVPIEPGVSLFVPAGLVHGFGCTGDPLHVLIVFPLPHFAETTFVEDDDRAERT